MIGLEERYVEHRVYWEVRWEVQAVNKMADLFHDPKWGVVLWDQPIVVLQPL